MKRTIFIFTLVGFLTTVATLLPGAEDPPAPASPPGRPTREELRERIKNLTPEERQARIKEIRERQGQGPAALSREDFEKRRQEREKLLNEIKDLPPEQRQARLREFREKAGLPRPGFKTLNPEERDAKRKEFQERVAKEISSLRADKTKGKLDEDGERSLQRMEMILKRLSQGGPTGVSGTLPPPADRPVKPSTGK